MNRTLLPFLFLLLLLGQVTAQSPAPTQPLINEDRSIEPIQQLIRFLSYLSHNNDRHAYALIAPSSIQNGDPVAYQAALDWASFVKELPSSADRIKFEHYHLGELRWESPNRIRVFVHFKNGDNDETLLVRENAQWLVADPIHIVR